MGRGSGYRTGRTPFLTSVEHDQRGRGVGGGEGGGEGGHHHTLVEGVAVPLEGDEALVAVPREMHDMRPEPSDALQQVLSGNREPNVDIHLVAMHSGFDGTPNAGVLPTDAAISLRGGTKHENAKLFPSSFRNGRRAGPPGRSRSDRAEDSA